MTEQKRGVVQVAYNHKQTKAGYVFPLILIAILAVGVFVATVSQLQNSRKKQYSHLDEYQISFNAAYSALVELLADLKTSRWSGRSFKTKPTVYTKKINDATCDLKASNHDSEEYVFNVKIRVIFHERKNLFYWRLKYNPSLLDFNTLVISQYFGQFDDSDASGYLDSLDKLVDEALKEQQNNKAKTKEIAVTIDNQDTTAKILETIGAIEKNSGSKIAEGEKKRPAPPEADFTPDAPPAKTLLDIVNEIEGADTKALQDTISSLPLKDIYPDKVDINMTLLREDIVVFFVRVLQLPEISSAAAISSFLDIDSDSVRNRSLGAARECEPQLVVGYPDGNFGPKDKIGRGQMGMVLERAAGVADGKLSSPDLSAAERRRFQTIKDFCLESAPKYTYGGSNVGLTIGEGLWVVTRLLEKIEANK